MTPTHTLGVVVLTLRRLAREREEAESQLNIQRARFEAEKEAKAREEAARLEAEKKAARVRPLMSHAQYLVRLDLGAKARVSMLAKVCVCV